MKPLVERLIPFFVLGIMIVIFVVGLVLLSYLLIFGALVGFILFMVSWVKATFFPSKQLTKTRRQGIVIDQEDKHR